MIYTLNKMECPLSDLPLLRDYTKLKSAQEIFISVMSTWMGTPDYKEMARWEREEEEEYNYPVEVVEEIEKFLLECASRKHKKMLSVLFIEKYFDEDETPDLFESYVDNLDGTVSFDSTGDYDVTLLTESIFPAFDKAKKQTRVFAFTECEELPYKIGEIGCYAGEENYKISQAIYDAWYEANN